MRDKPKTPQEQLSWLKLRFMQENYRAMADEAPQKNWSHQE